MPKKKKTEKKKFGRIDSRLNLGEAFTYTPNWSVSLSKSNWQDVV